MIKIHIGNHIWCCACLLDFQLECHALDHGSILLDLAAISNTQGSWFGSFHYSSHQSQAIGLLVARLIVLETYQCSKSAIPTKMFSLATPKTTQTRCSRGSIVRLVTPAITGPALMSPTTRIEILGFLRLAHRLYLFQLPLRMKLQHNLLFLSSSNHYL